MTKNSIFMRLFVISKGSAAIWAAERKQIDQDSIWWPNKLYERLNIESNCVSCSHTHITSLSILPHYMINNIVLLLKIYLSSEMVMLSSEVHNLTASLFDGATDQHFWEPHLMGTHTQAHIHMGTHTLSHSLWLEKVYWHGKKKLKAYVQYK